MSKKETPEERKERLRNQMAKARAVAKKNREIAKATGEPIVRKPKRPKNLDKIVRDILDDDELIDKVVANQPDYWSRLPVKNGGYIISTVMMVQAMGGNIKAAEWIRKTGFGDKVQLESSGGFFEKTDFTIQVVPAKDLESGIKPDDVLEGDIQQVEDE